MHRLERIMQYINVGVRYAATGEGVPTKKALKEAVKADPASVVAYGTSDFTPYLERLDATQDGVTLSVVGPDPYRKRSWYANVARKNGKLTVT